MKMLFRSYLSSLREREELDAILPDLLSELGFTVISRPSRGMRESGVDITAVSPAADGEEKLYLFTVKRGDITRATWSDATPQALRPSLNSILDAYIPRQIAKRHQHLRIVVAIVFGGEIHKNVRDDVDGYIDQHTTDRISFEEWNGDKLAELLMTGIMREETVPKQVRSHFQKAVAMVDEPDIAYKHFARLVDDLGKDGQDDKGRVRSARQMYIALWVLFVWARDIDNLEAAYQASELVALRLWHLGRPFIGKKTAVAKDMFAVVHHAIHLHVDIARNLLGRMVIPHVATPNGVSIGVRARSPADVNLKLFDILGRLAITGLWIGYIGQKAGEPDTRKAIEEQAVALASASLHLIQNNPVLLLPLQDIQSVEVCLFLMLAAGTGVGKQDIRHWLCEMARRYMFAVRSHGQYPCVFDEYRDLIHHPRERTEEYRKEATAGSTLIPVIAAFLTSLGEFGLVDELAQLHGNELSHSTLQVWVPDEATEEGLYVGEEHHGVALSDLHLTKQGRDLFEAIDDGLKEALAFDQLSAIKTGFWPVVLAACRHYRLPIPPHFWRPYLRAPGDADDSPGETAAAETRPPANS